MKFKDHKPINMPIQAEKKNTDHNIISKFGVQERDFYPSMGVYCRWCSEKGTLIYHTRKCHRVRDIEYYDSGYVKNVKFYNWGEIEYSNNVIIRNTFNNSRDVVEQARKVLEI